MAYRCHKKRRQNNWSWPIAAVAKKEKKPAWVIVAINQNAFWCIYQGQQLTWLPEVKTGTNLKTK